MAKNLDEMLLRIDEKLDEVSDSIHKVDKEVALQKAAFEEHQKQDEGMYAELKRMNDILQDNTESLKEHMHRTALLEQLVAQMDIRLSPIEREKIEKEAVKKYHDAEVERWIKYGKILGVIAALIGIVAGIKNF